VQVNPGISATASASQTQVGFKSLSADQKHVCLRRRAGFTFSRLAPYDRWRPFRDEARRLWTAYLEMCDPSSIDRLAVRYINRIDLPTAAVEMKDYFRTSPEISPDLPQTMAGFFMQVLLPQSDIASKLMLNQTIVAPARPDCVSVILDLDLFRDEAVPQTESEIWDFFELLHVRKNEVFEACITDKTREVFA
jgi:uncharacterized protein (TIGR04255 family)